MFRPRRADFAPPILRRRPCPDPGSAPCLSFPDPTKRLNRLPAALLLPPNKKEDKLQVLVRDNNVDQALKVLKKKLQREGVFREMKARRAYEKPSEKRVRQRAEAVRRSRKLARKQAQREGLLPKPKRKVAAAGPGRG